MTLYSALSRANYRWSLESTGVADRRGLVTRYGMRVTLTPDKGETVTQEFQLAESLELDEILRSMLKRYFPLAPEYLEYLASEGSVPAVLADNYKEWLGEAVHTGLRKLADTKESVITWKSIAHMADGDRGELWAAIEKALTDVFGEYKGAPTRLQVAKFVKMRACKCIDNLRYQPLKLVDGGERKRTEDEEYVLTMLAAGCELTSLHEWVWGWLGFVWKEEEEVEEADAVS